jgi:hypothetical protein
MRLLRGRYAPPSVALPGTAGFTVDPMRMTYRSADYTQVPYSVGTITPTVLTGAATWSLIGAQAEGFAISQSGAITCVSQQRMLDTGALLQLGTSRAFTARAQVGGTISDCAVTVTLNISAYTARWPVIPGLNHTVGRTSTNPLKVPGVDTMTSGWILNAGAGTITANTNNPGTLSDWDLTGYIVECGTKTGCVIQDNYFEVTAGMNTTLPSFNRSIINTGNAAGARAIVRRNTFKCNGDTYLYALVGLTGYFGAVEDNAIVSIQNDGANFQAAASNGNYWTTAASQILVANRSGVDTNFTNHTHCDGPGSFGVVDTVSIENEFVMNLNYAFREGATVRSPAGTASISGGGTTLTGSGTSWLNGSANDRISVGEWVTWSGAFQKHYVSAVNSDTSITVATTLAVAASGKTLLVGGNLEVRNGVTSPVYIVGIISNNSPIDLDYEQSATNCIAFGGDQVIQTTKEITPESGPVGEINARCLYKNVLLGNYYRSPTKYDSSWATAGAVQGCATLYDGSGNISLAEITDVNPVPTAPAFTQGATTTTTITLTFTSQDASIVYEYNLDGGAYSNLAGDKTITGLTTGTAYLIGLRGKNCQAESGTYLQVGAATTNTFSTS